MTPRTPTQNTGHPENAASLEVLSQVVDSDEINFMIYRYLQENGFVHSAFNFRQEALLDHYKIDNAQIPPGILLSFVQRGIDFLSIEEKVCDKKSDYLRDTTAPGGKRSLLDFHRYMGNQEQHDTTSSENKDVPMTDNPSPEKAIMIRDEPDENILKLNGHKMRVGDCKWDGQSPVLASCSYDNTGRIWFIPENFREKQGAGFKVKPKYKTLKHDILTRSPKKVLTNSLEVTAIAWGATGSTLATGCDDGLTRLWAPNGHLKVLHQNHTDAITVLKWNHGSTCFVSGSLDMTSAVCHKETAKCFKRFRHEQAVYDLDWKDDDVFASCSSDGMIRVCSVKGEFVTKTLLEHKGEINSVRFSTDGKHLASGCDDKTVKIWDSNSYDVIKTLEGHKREVYALDWAPDHKDPGLATGSFDSTVKVWNIQNGKCIQTMSHERTLIYSVKYSPDGKLIASGSDDGSLFIWCAKTGLVVKSFVGHGAVHGLDWYHTSDKLAVSRNNGALCVIDMRQFTDLKD